MLVLCANDYQYAADQFPGVSLVVHAPFFDMVKAPPQTWDIAEKAAERVAQCHRQGHKILVTCMAGLNRSGLVTAWAIHKIKGWDGQACATIVRQRRRPAAQAWDPYYPGPLCNNTFLRRILEL
jgi:protein-tyrosine phosphatase